MRKLAVLAVMVTMIMAIAAPVSPKAPAKAEKVEKTWVCHVTNSEKNPVVLVHVRNGWSNGHGNGNSARHQNEDAEYDAPAGTKAGPTDATDCTPPPPPTCEPDDCDAYQSEEFDEILVAEIASSFNSSTHVRPQNAWRAIVPPLVSPLWACVCVLATV